MKNKKITYGLLTGVIVVWGLICYKVFSAVEPEELPVLASPMAKNEYVKLVNHSNDEVMLNLNYRNPFLENSTDFIEETSENSIGVKAPKTTLPIKPQVNWSDIAYTGYINNTSAKLRLILITINGKELMLAEGQDLNGLKLLKYAGDSVKIQYQNESKYIRLK